MSIHFAPQWVKPIKPTGTAITPTAEHPAPVKTALSSINPPPPASTTNVPFPALTSNGSSASHVPTTIPPLSYSRATHTPTTPGFPSDSSYFPYTEPNGLANGNPHPFRYSREQMLGLWDEEKVRNTPIELVDMLENGGVLVSKSVIRPIGLRDLNETERKILSSTIHPAIPTRRTTSTIPPIDPALTPGQMSRRTIGQAGGKDASTPSRGPAGGAFGAFGSSKIGTIGGGMLSPGAGPGEVSRVPGALGGGFGGVGRRAVRRTESSGETGPWRTGRTTSGSFEGVLGFGAQQDRNPPTTISDPAVQSTSNTWKEKPESREESKEPAFGAGGGPGWGTGQKKWRIAAAQHSQETEKPTSITLPVQNHEAISESVLASASATPVQERIAEVEALANDAITPVDPPQAAQDKQDLGAVEWYYRDPEGQEQGPFAGSQMHDWYSHSYFTDDLPLRRSSETSFHTLSELKAATGNAVQPFLSAVRPRLPPNLPIPLAAAQPAAVSNMAESLRNIGLATPASSNPTPQPASTFNQFTPERSVLSPNHFAPQHAFANQMPSPAGTYLPSPGAWGAPQPRMNTFGSVGMPSPIGSGPGPFAPPPQQPIYSHIGAPIGRDGREFFSPSVGVGAHPASAWASQPIPPIFGQQPPSVPWQAEHQQPHFPPQQPQYYPQQPIQPPSAQQPPHPQEPEQVSQPPQPEQSYFPPTEPVAPFSEEATPLVEPETVEEEIEPIAEPVAEPEETEIVEDDAASERAEPIPRIPDQVEQAEQPTPVEVKPPVSVWGQKNSKIPGSAPSSRKSSIAGAAVPVQPVTSSSKLPPAPASLPPKPVSATSEAPAEKATATPDRTAPSARPAPWADKEGRANSSTGPSLREIQEAEAKEAEAKKAARAAAASPAPISIGDDIPQNLTWGLPTSSKSAAPTTPAVSSPSAPAWGGSDAAPKKTLKQIQEEEEKRKQKAAAAARAAQAASGPASAASKRGYADLAATTQPPGAGWTTVGAKSSAAPVAAAAVARPAAPVVKPIVSAVKPAIAKPKVDESTGPSVEFIRWTKQSLTGLNVNVDEFIQMLLTFPVDPPAADRPGILEVISDSVYANSSTLNGTRFAQEFFTRRKADAARPKGAAGAASVVSRGSLADVVKSVPKKSEDAGFRVVKAKGKKKN